MTQAVEAFGALADRSENRPDRTAAHGFALMCGIAGIVAAGAVNRAAIEMMSDIQAHRGPDDSGSWFSDDGHVGLGHRRLSVIDPSPAGHQPMVGRGGDHVICFNGEIYNYLELAARLRSLGSSFRSRCDTEVLLEAYRVWGEDCLAELNGMFAFAIYDKSRGTLFCARDRYGEKPFLFAKGPDFFAFASEYKALLSLAEVPAAYDDLRLARFLDAPSQGLDDEEATVFESIGQLLPGEALSLDTRSLQSRKWRYWEIRPDPALAEIGEDEAIARFRDLFIDSVRLRMRSDVAQGSCLSGGLDSTAIVCVARSLSGDDDPYHVFTGRFPGTREDEWPFAAQVVDATGAIAHLTEPTAEGFLDDLARFMWHNELPVGSTSQYAQWCIFSLASEAGITVLLDGQGADELLGGYEQYFEYYLAARAGDWGVTEHRNEVAAIRERYPLALAGRQQAFSRKLPFGVRRRLARWSGRGSDVLFGIHPDLASRAARSNRPKGNPRINPLTDALCRDSFEKHLPTLLRYGDRNSMAHAREVRLPFCDHRLAELVFSLPPAYLMGEAQTKRLLRESMRGIIPEAIRTRWNKQGFLPPQSLWFQGALLRHAEAVFEDPAFAADPMWERRWWLDVLARMKRGETQLGWVVWRPLIVDAWRRYFVTPLASKSKVSVFA